MEYLVISLQTAGALGSAVAGYTQGSAIQQYLNNSIIAKYIKLSDLNPNNIFNESLVCSLTGASIGLIIGYYVWPMALPISLAIIENRARRVPEIPAQYKWFGIW
jgi:hypothetical protein